jgi:hypothetical protein
LNPESSLRYWKIRSKYESCYCSKGIMLRELTSLPE